MEQIVLRFPIHHHPSKQRRRHPGTAPFIAVTKALLAEQAAVRVAVNLARGPGTLRWFTSFILKIAHLVRWFVPLLTSWKPQYKNIYNMKFPLTFPIKPYWKMLETGWVQGVPIADGDFP